MTSSEQALQYFSTIPPIRRPDGSVDYEALAGECLVEGENYQTVKAMYDALPEHLKDNTK